MPIRDLLIDPTPLAAVPLVVSVISLILLCVETWAVQEYHGGRNVHYGLFLKSGEKQNVCTDSMSTTQCGYLHAAQASGIIFLLLSIWTTCNYVPRIFKNVSVGSNRLLAATWSGVMQTTFGMLCTVFFGVWTDTFLNQDDRTNVEDEDEKFHSKLMGSYYLFIVLTVAVACQTALGFLLYRKTITEKAQ
jgi:hypothetical protein